MKAFAYWLWETVMYGIWLLVLLPVAAVVWCVFFAGRIRHGKRGEV